MTADLPTLNAVRTYVAVGPEYLPDADLQRMFDSAVEIVASTCRVPLDPDTGAWIPTGWPSPLVTAVLRRVQRSIATKALALGFVDSASEYGPARVPYYDTQIEENEGPFRRVVV